MSISTVVKGTVLVKIKPKEEELLKSLGIEYRQANGYCVFTRREGYLVWLGIRLADPVAISPFFIPKRLMVRRLDENFVLTLQNNGVLGFETKVLKSACVRDVCRDGSDKVLLTKGCLYVPQQVSVASLDQCRNLSMDWGYSAVINEKGKLLHLFKYGHVEDKLDSPYLKSLRATSLWRYIV
ncbi:MAG: hypothetical protein KIH89_003625 [Candidatus Shapirobacteria bacterium]|nr:hypothetical protein [Candidatus Shapirobacteria bacterium]